MGNRLPKMANNSKRTLAPGATGGVFHLHWRCVSNVGGCQYLGSLFTDGYTSIAANTNDIPGAVIVSNHMFRIEHTQLNLAQTSMEGFKLVYHQIPCTGSVTSYISSGY